LLKNGKTMILFRNMAVAILVFAALSAVAKADSISPGQARNYVGEYVTVLGVVSQVSRSRGGTTFINFGGRFPNHVFYGVIFKKRSGRFSGVFQLEGLKVAITGTISLYKGKPQIILDSPQQIEVFQ
jgi:hypothetical protein